MYIIIARNTERPVMKGTRIRFFSTNAEAEWHIADYCSSPRDTYVIFELTERPPV